MFDAESILTSLIVLPFALAAALTVWPGDDERIWNVSVFGSILIFLVSLKLLVFFEPTLAGFQLSQVQKWIPDWGIQYHVGIDGISLFLILLTTFLMPIVFLTAFGSIRRQLRAYLVSMFILQGAMIGTFAALDMVLFFLFWELMLVPMAILIGVWGGARRIYSAVKFFLYTAVGSALMLVCILYLVDLTHARTERWTFDLLELRHTTVHGRPALLMFLGFALAFAIKIPMFPLHTWLPDAHTDAPTGGSIILAGVLLKMGVYGFFRFCLPLFPDVAYELAPVFIVLGVIGIVYGALVSIVQKDMKRLVAFSSVSHLGFCVVGLFSFTPEGWAGSYFILLAHGLSTGALFLLVGFIYDRRHTRMIADYGGIAQPMPFYAAAFVFTALASAGLPGLAGFVGEFLTLAGAFLSKEMPAHLLWPLMTAAVSVVIWAAVYLLWMVQRVFFGPIVHEENRTLTDLTARERCAVFPLLAFMLILGIYPKMILDRVEPSFESLRLHIKAKHAQILQERHSQQKWNELPLDSGQRLSSDAEPAKVEDQS